MLRIHWYTEFRHRANQGEAEADSGSGREPGRQNGGGAWQLDRRAKRRGAGRESDGKGTDSGGILQGKHLLGFQQLS